MKTGLTISASAHAAVLLWALVSFAPKALNAPPAESMPVDLISSTEFSQLRAGARNAPKSETPKPPVEKIAERKTSDNPAAKVVEKPELVTASAQTPPPAEEKVPERKATENKEPKSEPKLEPKPDAIADVLKKEAKPEPKKEAKPQPKKPDPKPQPKFDANRIAALLDKRDPQRVAAAGDTINHTLAFGTATGEAPRLAQSELDALRARLRECWNPPAGAVNADKLKVPILIRFKQDGTLASPPQPENAASDAFMQAMTDSAVRATIRCQPYTMLSPAKYDLWKEIVVDFSLDGMFGG
ncbi:MAG TPA: protein TolA [Xanthobacteraceae bacterium]|nr:protein TolA [Xanthobacteraceae bacterium]